MPSGRLSALLLSVLACAAWFLSAGCGSGVGRVPKIEAPALPASPAPFTDPLGIAFVPVPGGKAVIGTDKEADPASPPHEVAVRPFYLASTELTVAQWREYFRLNKSHRWGMWNEVRRYSPTLDCPVVCLSWEDCDVFCRFMSRATGLTYRLPTEEEWEYAARLGESAPSFDRAAFFRLKAQYPYAHPVKALRPDALGLYGMVDNAWEWTASDFLPYPRSRSSHPLFGYVTKVLRGGGFRFPCPVWKRNPASESIRNFSYGLRPVVEP